MPGESLRARKEIFCGEGERWVIPWTLRHPPPLGPDTLTIGTSSWLALKSARLQRPATRASMGQVSELLSNTWSGEKEQTVSQGEGVRAGRYFHPVSSPQLHETLSSEPSFSHSLPAVFPLLALTTPSQLTHHIPPNPSSLGPPDATSHQAVLHLSPTHRWSYRTTSGRRSCGSG